MDWQIRLALLVAGISLVAFIFFDYSRRKKKQRRKQQIGAQTQSLSQKTEPGGFDQDGVGSVRKLTSVDLPSEQELGSQSNSLSESAGKDKVAAGDALSQSSLENNPDEPSDKNQSRQKSAPTEQLSLDEIDITPENAKREGAADTVQTDKVISLILRAQPGSTFSGKDFMPLLLSQGLRHGEMQIFHRHHAGASGKPGPVQFSVANAIAPGIFDIDNIEQFKTPAFAFFMQLPGAKEPIKAFENMVNTIKLLQRELGGQILDESKSVYTEQTHQYQVEQLQAYLTRPVD